MYHLRAFLDSNVNKSFARCNSDFSFVQMSAPFSMNVRTLTRMTKVFWWVD